MLKHHEIFKVTNPADYLKLLDNLEQLWDFENENLGHIFKIDKASLAQIANPQLLTWQYHVWSNKNLDSIIMFQGGWNLLHGKKSFQEIIWLSKSNCGLKLLNAALDFAKNQQYDIVVMGSVAKAHNPKLDKIYQKLKLQKDGEIWTGKI